MQVRPGRIGAITVLALILGAVFFMGLFFWTILHPDFGLAYNIPNPNQPFPFKRPVSHEAEPAEAKPELSFNETLAALKESDCAIVEGEPDNFNPDNCILPSQQEFMDTALNRKLVFMQEGEDAYTLYVPVKNGHVIWRWLKEPA